MCVCGGGVEGLGDRCGQDYETRLKQPQERRMDLGEGSERKWLQRPDSAVYILGWDLKVAMYPSSPTAPLPTLSLPPLLRWPAPLRASRGTFLPQLGVQACVAACLYWSVDFLVAACTYLNIPLAAALCSWPCTAPSPPWPPPLLPSSSPRQCALSHTLFLFHHSFFLTLPVVLLMSISLVEGK